MVKKYSVEKIVSNIKENRDIAKRLKLCTGVTVVHYGEGGIHPQQVQALASAYLSMTDDIIEVLPALEAIDGKG